MIQLMNDESTARCTKRWGELFLERSQAIEQAESIHALNYLSITAWFRIVEGFRGIQITRHNEGIIDGEIQCFQASLEKFGAPHFSVVR